MEKSDSHLIDVREFARKMGHGFNDTPTQLTRDELKARIIMMFEELCEFTSSCGLLLLVDGKPLTQIANNVSHEPRTELVSVDDPDLPEQADALVDLAYFTVGTAAKLGLPWGPLWNDVHRANMGKEPGTTHRGVAGDAIKPEGWEGPKTLEILKAFGYKPVSEVV